MAKSSIPFASEFSPSIVDLSALLALVEKHKGDPAALETGIAEKYPNLTKIRVYNCRKGMETYGLIDAQANPTEIAQELAKLRGEPDKLHERFAKHILLNVSGNTLIDAVLGMQKAGIVVSQEKLSKWYKQAGMVFGKTNKNASVQRLWLEKAGVIDKNWTVDAAKLDQIRGVGAKEIEALAALDPGQQYFLRALAKGDSDAALRAKQIQELASTTFGYDYPEKNFAQDVLKPLEAAGYISLEKGAKGKDSLIRRTEKLRKDVVIPLLKQYEKQVRPEIRPFMRKSLAGIVKELESEDTYVKGLALEALAIKLMLIIDMEYAGTRVRGKQTGGGEVDVIFHSARLAFSRWQVQCKNVQGGIKYDDVAKEFGVSTLLKSNVIVMVSNGPIGAEARNCGRRIMAETNLCVVMIDRRDLQKIIVSPLVEFLKTLQREAKNALELKTPQLPN